MGTMPAILKLTGKEDAQAMVLTGALGDYILGLKKPLEEADI